MIIKSDLVKGRYYDSVTLMAVARELAACGGVSDAAAVMGTDSNKAILRASGLLSKPFEAACDADLLIAVKARDDKAAGSAMARVEELLKAASRKGSGGAQGRPRSLEAALELLPKANLAVLSVAGKYAAAEAMRCLERGLHVMIFSDNVSLEDELALKKYAWGKGLLVMGPDCGTAIINGAPLAFANVVRRGGIGVVSAAGTGLQEVTCLISNEGGGISQAIGTGGRDVKKEVGGIMFIAALKALLADDATKVVLLVSKPPHESVLKKIGAALRGRRKPVVAVFLGTERRMVERLGVTAAETLEEAALSATALALGRTRTPLAAQWRRIVKLAEAEAAGLAKGQRSLRGLFSGGTFCAEAQVIFRRHLREGFSNAPIEPFKKLKDSWKSEGHSFVDLGEDEFTRGRPHPMIDYSVRNKRIVDEAADPSAAVIQLDVVLGHGSNMRPAQDIVPAVREAFRRARKGKRRLIIVATVTGTAGDPQDKTAVEAALRAEGVLVEPSNAAASLLSAMIVKEAGR